MSDGISDARRTADQVGRVEDAAETLAEALLATGDRMFFNVHPQAVEYANAVLADHDVKYRLSVPEPPRAGVQYVADCAECPMHNASDNLQDHSCGFWPAGYAIERYPVPPGWCPLRAKRLTLAAHDTMPEDG